MDKVGNSKKSLSSHIDSSIEDSVFSQTIKELEQGSPMTCVSSNSSRFSFNIYHTNVKSFEPRKHQFSFTSLKLNKLNEKDDGQNISKIKSIEKIEEKCNPIIKEQIRHQKEISHFKKQINKKIGTKKPLKIKIAK